MFPLNMSFWSIFAILAILGNFGRPEVLVGPPGNPATQTSFHKHLNPSHKLYPIEIGDIGLDPRHLNINIILFVRGFWKLPCHHFQVCVLKLE